MMIGREELELEVFSKGGGGATTGTVGGLMYLGDEILNWMKGLEEA